MDCGDFNGSEEGLTHVSDERKTEITAVWEDDIYEHPHTFVLVSRPSITVVAIYSVLCFTVSVNYNLNIFCPKKELF